MAEQEQGHAGEPSRSETSRLEAFSDGVFAVAITLLALDLSVPRVALLHPGHDLAAALVAQWPAYLAYGLSFLTILIIWANHHTIFRFIKSADHPFLLLNGLLLMIVTAIPFATSLLADYLLEPDRKTAQVVYSGVSLVMALTYNRMWAYASHRGRLLDPHADQGMVRAISHQFSFGPPLYVIAFALAFVSAELSLALCIALAIFFALPSTVTRGTVSGGAR